MLRLPPEQGPSLLTVNRPLLSYSTALPERIEELRRVTGVASGEQRRTASDKPPRSRAAQRKCSYSRAAAACMQKLAVAHLHPATRLAQTHQLARTHDPLSDDALYPLLHKHTAVLRYPTHVVSAKVRPAAISWPLLSLASHACRPC